MKFLRAETSFVDLLWIMMEFDMFLVPLFLTISWEIREYRNSQLFESTMDPILQVVDQCIDYVASFTSIKNFHLILRNENVLEWQPPPYDKVKLNFDGTLFSGTNFVVIGVILMNNTGVVLFALSIKEMRDFYVDDVEA